MAKQPLPSEREKAIITYDENLLQGNPLAEDSISGNIKAITIDTLKKSKKVDSINTFLDQ
jgi:hypothetical protein